MAPLVVVSLGNPVKYPGRVGLFSVRRRTCAGTVHQGDLMFNRTKNRGFTLLELIVVIVILGILAALAIPSFTTVKSTAAQKVAYSTAQAVVRSAEASAAFDGVSLDNAHVDAAIAELSSTPTSDISSADGGTVTVTSGGQTATATISSTGVISVSSGSGTPSVPLLDLSAYTNFPFIGSGDNTSQWDATHRVLWRLDAQSLYTWMNDSYFTNPSNASQVANYCSQTQSSFIQFSADPTLTPTTGTSVC